MLYHRAFSRDLDTLTVAVVDNRKPMLSLMRSMLAAIGVARIIDVQQPIYVPPEPGLTFLAWASEEDPALTLDVIMKARAAPH